MKKITTILFVAAVLVLMTATGCDVTASRKQCTQQRFERMMNQTRLETARQSLAQGQYAYARKVLEPCLNTPGDHQDAEQLMVQIQTADRVYAQLLAFRDQNAGNESLY